MQSNNSNSNSNSGMYNMHTVQQPADLNNSLLNTPFNKYSTFPAYNAQPAARSPYQQRTTNKNYVKRHSCPWEGCDRLFAGPHNVRQHVREQHTGERSFKCPECLELGHDKGFARPFSLNRHRRQIHNVDNQKAKGAAQGAGENATAEARDADVGGAFRMVLFGNNGGMAYQPQATTGVSQSDGMNAPNVEDELLRAFAAHNSTHAHNANNANIMPNVNAEANIDDFFDMPNDQLNLDQDFGLELLTCDECQHRSDSMNSMLHHLHDAHQAPYSQLCNCSICEMLYAGDDATAAGHARELAGGALGLLQKPGEANSQTKPAFDLPNHDMMEFELGDDQGLLGSEGFGNGVIDPSVFLDL